MLIMVLRVFVFGAFDSALGDIEKKQMEIALFFYS